MKFRCRRPDLGELEVGDRRRKRQIADILERLIQGTSVKSTKGCPRDQSLSYIKRPTLRKKARPDISSLSASTHHTLLAPCFSHFKLVSLAAHLEMG